MKVLAAIASASCAVAHLPVQEAVDATHSQPLKTDTSVCPYDQEQAIYGSLDSKDDVDVFELEVPEFSEDFFLHVALPVLPFDRELVPEDRRRGFTTWVPFSFLQDWWMPKQKDLKVGEKVFKTCPGNNARPAIAVVGPGIETDVGSSRWFAKHQHGCGNGKKALPFYIASDEGAVVNDFEEDFPYYEDFESGHTIVGVKKFVNLKPGTYKFYVWDPLGRTGNYLAVFGRNEGCYDDARGYGPVGKACYWLVEESFNSNCGERVEIPACCCFLPIGTGVCPSSAETLNTFCNDFRIGGRPLPFEFNFSDDKTPAGPPTTVTNPTNPAGPPVTGPPVTGPPATGDCQDDERFGSCADLLAAEGITCDSVDVTPPGAPGFVKISPGESCPKTCGRC